MTETLSPSQQQELDRLNYGMDIGPARRRWGVPWPTA